MSNTSCVGVATQSCQGRFEAAICLVSGSPSAFQVSGEEFTLL